MERPIVALIYDFDDTLIPRAMQEFGYMKYIDMAPDKFWQLCADFRKKHNADNVLAYMCVMLELAKERGLTRQALVEMGRDIEYYPGVETWFDRVNEIGRECGVDVEHYIISSGVSEIIEGSVIGDRFKAVFAASFCYDDAGRPMWPAMAVNYTAKTQYLFRINKGILDMTNHSDLNAYTPKSERRVPFENMVYIGDGFTDVPCMKMTRQRGGYAIAVHGPENADVADDLLLQDRVDFAAEADYRAGSELESIAGELFRRIRATYELNMRHERQLNLAAERRGAAIPDRNDADCEEME